MSEPNPLRARSLAACLALALPLAAGAAELARGDSNFMKKAAESGLMEVELGRLAQQKSASDAVRQFGKRMEDDHSKANDRLESIASAKGVELPAAPQKKHIAKLEDKSGADFDRAYMQHMVSDHKKDVSEFEKQARSAKDADVKAFASETLPTLREHRKLAEETHNAVKSSRGAKLDAK